MSAVSPRANRAKIPHDFPNPHRLGGTDLFRAVLGNPAASTFARWRKEGRLPPPRKIGALNRWPETAMEMPKIIWNNKKAPLPPRGRGS